jgi:small nuclear ribonucleoprotein (snRNP)-like protein
MKTKGKIMLKKYFTLIITVLVFNLFLSIPAFANTKAEKEAKFAAKVKSEIAKLGTGKEARVEVKLKDGTKLKGYVSQINENSFVVVDNTTGASTEVPYPNAKQVKGNNLSTGVKIAIGIGVVLLALAIIYFIAPGR